jgi:hypothetical protein
VGLVKQTPEVRQGIQSIRQAFGEAAKIFTQKGQADLARAARAQEVIYLKRYIESARLPQALEAAEKAIAHGWSPVIFSEYRSGSDDEGMKFFNKLPKGVADQLNALLPPLPDVVDAVRERFGDQAAIFAGSANQLRGEEREGFMAGVKRALYATYAAGGIGVGFHDKLGARPRMGIFLGLPWSGIMFEQSLGRTWRYGTKSNVVNLFLASDTLPEIKLLATKILPRMRALNAAVHGEAIEGRLAKLLREAAGIHADMVDYELGAEDAPDAAHFEHTVTDQDLPLAGGPEVVHGLEARDAIGPGKGMKYRQAVSKLYQLARDMVTLYRGEARPGSGKAPADWIQESDAYKEQQQAQRRWFTPSLEDAKWYQEDAGEHGHIVSVQVPRADLEKYSALNNPEARRFVHNTKVLAGQNDEYFLPRHLAARAEPYTSKLYQQARENVKEQTDTAEFKAWFGASQVVDESGKPLRVYHGTTRDFAQFDAERLGGNTGHVTAALGFFFTRDPEVAELFNSEMGTLKSSRKPKPSEGAQTLPVFLKIHRPYEIAAEAWKQLLGSDVDLARMERQRKLLQSRGYDGVHIKGDPKYKGDEYSADQWVAFQPTQIKSAIGNRGSFDAQHPNILYQQARDRIGEDASAAVTKAFADPSLTPQERFALLAARAGIELHAAVAGGEAVENGLPGQPEMERVAQDARIGLQLAVQEHAAGAAERASLLDRLYAHLPDQGKIALYKRKAEAQSLRNYITDWVRIYHTSGEQAIRKYMADAGGKFVAWGRDIQRLLIARSHLLTQYQGEFMEQVRETLAATPEKLFPLAVRVLEGRATSRDPQVLQAAEGLREFFAYVRQRLADSGAYLPVYEGGEKRAIAYQDIEEDPHYWPHIYHWTEPLVLNGEVTTLAKIQDIPVGTERREQMIAAWAGKMGVSKLEADLFFEKHRRDIRLAGNLEKGRFSALPGYGESARELSIYIRQASEILANIKTVGQEREKINPWIFALPDSKIRKLVDGIVTADLNPLALGEDNRTTLRLASQSTILTMMGMSSLKVGYHAWKTTMVTNTRSLARGILSVAAHPREVPQLVREAGILNDYVRQQMMMEYGLHSGGLAQGLLTWTGFTPLIWVTRLFAAASGRVYLEHYIVPELQRAWKLRENVKANTTVGSVEIHIPGEAALRRQLKDLYAFSDADIDRIAREGPDTNDVKRAMITAADWTTGSGRPSELPPVMHLETDSKVTQSRLAFVRLSWQLKTFAFKTANLVNRTVFEGLRDPGWKDKEYQALARFMFNAGAAGMGMQLMMIGVKSKTNPAGAEEDKRRLEAALHNPKDLLWLELANVSFAVGLYPAKLVFDTLGTHSPQDKKKANARLKYGLLEEVEGGIIGSQALALRKMVLEEVQTFRDDGIRHKKTPPQRRKDAAMNFVHSTVPAERAVEGLLGGKPAVAPAAGGPRPRRTRAARRARGR